MEVLPCLINDVVWQVGSGNSVRIGIDEMVGGEEFFRLSNALINRLHTKDFFTLDHT